MSKARVSPLVLKATVSMKAYKFTFNIHAISKDNEKIFNRRTGRPFTSAKYKAFENTLQMLARVQMPADFKMYEKEDLQVYLTYTFKNKVHSDIGNLPKSTLDAFNKFLWKDDKQIKILSVEILYGDSDKIELTVAEWVMNGAEERNAI